MHRPVLALCLGFACLFPALSLGAQRTVQVDLLSATVQGAGAAGYRLYDETGRLLCELRDPTAVSMTCQIETQADSLGVRLTSFLEDGTESAPSGTITVTFPELPDIQSVFSCTKDGLSIRCDGTASVGDLTGYRWELGDGTRIDNENVITHTYAVAGEYTVTLAVTDSAGQQSTSSQVVRVESASGGDGGEDGGANQPPSAVIRTLVGGRQVAVVDGDAPLTVTFDGSGSSDPDGDALAYRWNFGDNSQATGPLASHTYAVAGDYTVTLTVTDTAGNQVQASTVVKVSAGSAEEDSTPPVARILVSPAVGELERPLTFDGTSSAAGAGGGRITRYLWNFGDGSTGEGATLVHAYRQLGEYTVTLIVVDDQGASAQATYTVRIRATNHALDILQAVYSILLK